MYQWKGGAIQGWEYRPPLPLGVVAIEKGAFWSPLTKGDNFTFILVVIFRTVSSSLLLFVETQMIQLGKSFLIIESFLFRDK